MKHTLSASVSFDEKEGEYNLEILVTQNSSDQKEVRLKTETVTLTFYDPEHLVGYSKKVAAGKIYIDEQETPDGANYFVRLAHAGEVVATCQVSGSI